MRNSNYLCPELRFIIMKKLYLLIFAAVLAVNVSAYDLGGSTKSRHQVAEFVEHTQRHTVTANAPQAPQRVKSKVGMADPINVQELQNWYMFHFLGYVGSDLEAQHYTASDIQIIAGEGNNVKIGPFYFNVYFDGVFDFPTQTITLSSTQEQALLDQPSVKLTIYDYDFSNDTKSDVVLKIDADSHMIYWESSSSAIEVAQVGRDVAAMTIMGLYLDYANTFMASYDIRGTQLVGPFINLLWVEPTDDGKISVSNFCEMSTLYPMILDVDQESRTATATDAKGFTENTELNFWQLDSNDEPTSRTLTFNSGIYNLAEDPDNSAKNFLALTNAGVGAFTEDMQAGLKFADIQLVMPFNPFGTGIDNLNAGKLAPIEYYNLQGVRVDNPGHGLYIMRQGNTTRKVIR